ncbi:MAG: hypothetical protein GYA55_12810 [SAR324 cluster bacterium]|uniref:Uncharacterized protein n=1 Tax=SAR324 cluster bacterium TaxID=2024889 RepID=A0A7X9FTV4_9DELT|nr:hypothetical protein [SAR324 cluster bacterium]
MRIVCKDRRYTDLVGHLKKDTTLLNLTIGAAPSERVYSVLDKYLSEWSRFLISDALSPKKK